MGMQFFLSACSTGKIKCLNCVQLIWWHFQLESTPGSTKMGSLELQDCIDCAAFLLEQNYNGLSICTFHLCIVFSLFRVFRKCYALQTAGLVFSVE